jgi:hypothetical protein
MRDGKKRRADKRKRLSEESESELQPLDVFCPELGVLMDAELIDQLVREFGFDREKLVEIAAMGGRYLPSRNSFILPSDSD